MKQVRSPSQLSPVLEAARRRPLRGAKGGGGGGKSKNNYIAEISPSGGKNSGNRKGAGARPGNLNAVNLPHRTPEDIALYRRYAAFLGNAKAILAQIKAQLRERNNTFGAPP